MPHPLTLSTAPELGRIKAVCLDFDDTLLDNEAASRHGLKALVGTDAAWPVWKRITDECYAAFLAGSMDFNAMCRERTRAFFAAFGETISDVEARRRERRRMAAMQEAWRLFDDSVPSLRQLRAHGLRLAIITNAPGAYQRKKINAVGIADAFETIVISGELGVAKPDSRIFRAACTNLGLQPHEVMHVGDRLDVDAAGASRAGMHGVWLNRGGSHGTAPPGALVIHSLAALPELLTNHPRTTQNMRIPGPRAEPDAGPGSIPWPGGADGPGSIGPASVVCPSVGYHYSQHDGQPES